jgi:hypothetical protein
MGYSENPESVRVDFFKPSGKWYMTEAVLMDWGYNEDPFVAFSYAIRKHLYKTEEDKNEVFKNHFGGAMSMKLEDYRASDMTAVCLEPYNHQDVPLMTTVEDCIRFPQGHKPVAKSQPSTSLK